MKAQAKKEKAMCKRFKKRHRKDLTPEEIEDIVAASKMSHRLHKDIAKDFKVPAILVGKLVKESLDEPRRLEAYRAKLQLDQEKKQAIEDVTTRMLAANKPIIRLQ